MPLFDSLCDATKQILDKRKPDELGPQGFGYRVVPRSRTVAAKGTRQGVVLQDPVVGSAT